MRLASMDAVSDAITDLHNKLQSDIENDINDLDKDLTNNINNVQSGLTNDINNLEKELTNDLNDLEKELRDYIDEVSSNNNQNTSAGLSSLESRINSELAKKVNKSGDTITGNLNVDGTITGSLSGNASSATKLQKAITINGTNFDGSLNITTNNWGTSRNMVITDADGTNTGAAVSVNGSSAISLKLPSVIKASISGNATTATTLANSRTINGTSFNGSENITTSIWGATRNISISDSNNSHTGAATSANGGSNITLKLPETITATLNGNASTATALTSNAGSNTQPVYFNGGKPVVCKPYYSKNEVGDIGWNNTSVDTYSPTTVSAIAYWNGAYAGTSSNLTYCSKGAFGTIVTKNAGDYSPSGHEHNYLTSRGAVTCENGVTARPAVTGLSMSQVYNNGYPTPYGNVISLRGSGDGQILVGWSGTDGAHAPVYVRSKRDNTSTANWSGWAQIYTTANRPSAADIGASPSGHNHDGRYSPSGHNHDGRYSPSGHNHDDRYYTEGEVNNLVNGRVDWGSYNGFVGKFYMQDGRMLYMCSWDPGAIGAGNVWIQCG
jgi:hypothetical protein